MFCFKTTFLRLKEKKPFKKDEVKLSYIVKVLKLTENKTTKTKRYDNIRAPLTLPPLNPYQQALT